MDLSHIPTVAFWQGKPLHDYSKEELIQIATVLGRELDSERNRHMGTLDLFSQSIKKAYA